MKIAPSILNANNMDLGSQIQTAIDAGITRFHIDVMDAHFVPNLSYGPELVKDFKNKFPNSLAEVHLMSNALETMIPAFVKNGTNLLEFHYEATDKIDYWLDYLHDHNLKAGIVLNPETNIEVLKPYLNKVDQVLLMSVHPGFGGQRFIENTLVKIKELKAIKPDIPVEIDGGINYGTGKLVYSAGADIIVAGSYIFNDSASIVNKIKKLQDIR